MPTSAAKLSGRHQLNGKIKGAWSLRVCRVFLAVLLSTAAGHAATMYFVTPPGATITSQPISAQVTFITGLNTMEVQVQNLQSNIQSDIQAISSIDWLLKNPDNSTTIQPSSDTLKTSSVDNDLGQVANFDSNGNYTFAGLDTISNRWALFTTGTQFTGGTQLSIFTKGTPSQQIIGLPPYNANGSISAHTPFLETSGSTHISFIINYGANSGVTNLTTVTRAMLNFGTVGGAAEISMITETPEPDTVALSLAGIALIAIGCLRRRSTTGANSPR